jgi:hypothetical protein
VQLRVAVYAASGLAVGYIMQDGDRFRVELLRDGCAISIAERFTTLLEAFKRLLEAEGE